MPDGLTIVLDPGHGGENLGLNYNGYVEKEMNQIVAAAMKEELEKYDNVTVYITNEECKDMSLKERARYGSEKGADVLISLHFNMSETHGQFGSEVWVPSRGLAYRQMRSLGDVFLEEFEGIGLHTRGVKARLNDEGEDYYGILRESQALGMNALLVEHCYADYKTDIPYIDSKEDLERFGQLDARAVAKYYGLSSGELGVDYSAYVKNGYYIPEEPVGSDASGPMNARVYLIDGENAILDEHNKTEADFLLTATEEESKIAYYAYSLDGGATYTELFAWTGNENSMQIHIDEITKGDKLLVKIYNGHTVESETNELRFGEKEPSETGKKTDTASDISEEGMEELISEKSFVSNGEGAATFYRKTVPAFLAAMVVIAFLIVVSLYVQKKQKKIKKTVGIFVVVCLLALGTFTGVRSYIIYRADATVAALTERQRESLHTDVEDNDGMDAEEKEPIWLKSFLNEEELISREEAEALTEQKKQTEIVYDIAEGYLRVDTLEAVPRNQYDFQFLTEENGYKAYKDSAGIHAIRGIDVSKFQGNIDWQAVKDSGMEFAMIRIGLRGYGSGQLVMDERFYENIKNAQAAGLQTGVYFFSAAVSTEEAVEEAEFVIKALEGYELSMPVVFDTEPIYSEAARTDDLTPAQLTEITIAFCEKIRQSGYTPMIYANAKRLTTVLNLEKLSGYEVWYADYQEKPIYPYRYKMWQYTEKGSVPGIQGTVDINLYFQ